MFRGKKITFTAVSAVICTLFMFSDVSLNAQTSSLKNLGLEDKIPSDSKVITGKLPNGVKYYIRQNHKPENRAELRLVINAGSILENDSQQGLAHFSEHMAFNGTKNFKKQELVDYLELIGMRFGPDLNAYTGFDETVYMLQIPTDKSEIMDKAFLILEDWAHNVSYTDDEIDKERGVIIEEWRLGRGAEARVRDKHFPVLFSGSKYAERLPIGKKDILENFKHDTLRNFYNIWYRPDLEAVIAVGDFDVDKIKKQIESHFSGMTAVNKEKREIFPVPDNKGTLFSIVSDPELTETSVEIYTKLEVTPEEKVKDYRRNIVENLFTSMLNQRFDELTRVPNPPFMDAYSAADRIVASKKAFILGATVDENGIDRGLETLLTEARRIKLHGFSQSELDRQKKEMLRGMEKAFEERDKTESRSYASEYIRNYTDDEPMPGIEYEYELMKKYLPGISAAEINSVAKELLKDESRVVLVSLPQKDSVKAPDEKHLKDIMDKAEKENVAAYKDDFAEKPLFDENLVQKNTVSEKAIPELGVTEIVLSNGVRVILKPTDFKNDEVIFTSFSPGGYSLVPDDSLTAATTAASIIGQSGLKDFSEVQLEKKLAGKLVSVSPWIDDIQEGISGSASPQDMETMLQLIYMYFTDTRKDSDAFISMKDKMASMIKNRSADPESAFEDTLDVTLANYSPRVKPLTMETLGQLNLDASLRIYKNRFADASDFTFIFVGNFDPVSLKQLLGKYLGNLPSSKRAESWKDDGIRPPKGIIQKQVFRGIEPKSSTRMVFSGPFVFNRQNRYEIQSLVSAMRIKLREVMREDKSGTYGVGLGLNLTHYPYEGYSLSIGFGCAPERADEMIKDALGIIEDVKKNGVDDTHLEKVKEMQLRERETAMKQNSFWLNNLNFYYSNNEDPLQILGFEKLVNNLNSETIKKSAQKYFNTGNYVTITLLPENKK